MTTTTRNFQRAEAIICEIEVRDEDGVLVDPATTMTVTITDPDGTVVVGSPSPQAMSQDSTGVYHYDYTPGPSTVLGWYLVHYVATDGARVTIEDDGFTLEA